ncbi:flagellin [Sodalis sp. RH14]|uniref:flagellin N-terminal helical domain-containing protein n=1 Tax=Sodalis sp. RH14 TaxID=3394329 RepID=UPI0039B4C43B
MAQVINTNSISLLAQNNLNKSQSKLSTAIERLSSGLRINSAKDDAAGQAISNRFTSNINGLTQASRNANDGISLAQTTEGALDEINTNLQAIRTLTVQSQTGTNSASDLQSIQDEVTQRLSEVDRISQQTDFNGVKVLSQNKTLSIQVGSNDGEVINIDLQKIDSTTLTLNTFNVNGPNGTTSAAALSTGTAVAATGTVALTATAADATGADAAVKTAIGTSTKVISDGTDYYIEGDDGKAYKATTTIDKTGKLTATVGAGVTNTDLTGKTVNTVTAGSTAAYTSLAATVDAAGNADATNIGAGTLVADAKGNYSVVTSAGKSYAATVSVDGSGVLTAKVEAATTAAVSVATDTNKDSKIDSANVSIVQDKNNHYFIKDTTDGTTADKVKYYAADVTTDDDGKITSAAYDSSKSLAVATTDPLKALDSALSTVDTLRSKLGAVENRFDSTINNLASTNSNLSEAQSRIQDADYATEVSNMSKAQILQQAGTSVLAQANQVPQTVLKLLQ